jgi:hypothetical protein
MGVVVKRDQLTSANAVVREKAGGSSYAVDKHLSSNQGINNRSGIQLWDSGSCITLLQERDGFLGHSYDLGSMGESTDLHMFAFLGTTDHSFLEDTGYLLIASMWDLSVDS